MTIHKVLYKIVVAGLLISGLVFLAGAQQRAQVDRETLASILSDIAHKGVDPITTGSNREGRKARP